MVQLDAIAPYFFRRATPWIRAGADPVRLIDVRSGAEVTRGVIAGAIRIPLHSIALRPDEPDNEMPTVVYCQSAAVRCRPAAFLATRDFRNLYNLAGGGAGRVRVDESLAVSA